MIFHPPLVEATFVRRYKRFLVDVLLADGAQVTAHTNNTGRMTCCLRAGCPVLLSPIPEGRDRKLRWRLRLTRPGRAWVSVDTAVPNQVIADTLRRRRIVPLAGYDEVRTEVQFGAKARSRIDVKLTHSAGALPPCFVEVKNVTLIDQRTALFPDAVSDRAVKHLEELALEVKRGHRAVLIPFVARADCDGFGSARAIDPRFADALLEASAAGVEVLPYAAIVRRSGVRLGRPLPWRESGDSS